MERQDQIDAAFERGRRVGRTEGSMFAGIRRSSLLPGAEFEFQESLFESFVQYERMVVFNLRALQMERRQEQQGRRRDPDRPSVLGLPDSELARVESEIKAERRKVQAAVDAELAEGRGRACIIDAMRASPQLPSSVTEYESVREFVAEDRRRAVLDWPAREDLAGADIGYAWQLEDSLRRWITTSWRISWLCETNKTLGMADDDDLLLHGDGGESTTEVYAVESINPLGGGVDGRVWLLGKLNTRQKVDQALRELQRYAIHERNSLIAAAEAVAAATR